MKKPRVLLITARADIGGGPRHVFDLASEISEQVELFIASPAEKPYGPLFKEMSQGFFEIPKRRFSIQAAFSLMSFCRKHNIEIVHSHGRGAGTYSRFLGIFGWKVVHTFHGFHVQSGMKDKIILSIERFLASFTLRFIAVSSGEFDRVLQFKMASPDKLKLIFNGIATKSANSVFQTNPNENSSVPPVILGSLTRFDPQKGNHLLVELVHKLPSSLKDQIVIKIAGEGPEKEHIDQLIQKFHLEKIVQLVGAVSDPDAFLSACHVFVSASLGEGLSYATLETLRMGKPLLLSRVTGHTELEGIAGVSFFSLSDASEFQRALRNYVELPLTVTQLPEKFTLTAMARDTLNLYRTLESKTALS